MSSVDFKVKNGAIVNTYMSIGNSSVNTFANSTTLSVTQIYANNSFGNPGQVIATDGTKLYWSNNSTGFATFQFVDSQFTGDGTTKTFTLNSSVGTTNSSIVTINGVKQIPTLSYTVVGNTLTFTDSVATNAIVDVLTPSYVAANGDIIAYRNYYFTATAGQTTFSGFDNNNLTLSYIPGATEVFLNGIKQINTVDYTASNGSAVVLTSPAYANDTLEVSSFGSILNYNLPNANTANSILSVNGHIIDFKRYYFNSSSQQTIDSWSTGTYRSAKYFVQITDNTGSAYHIQDISLLQDGTNVKMAEYGEVYSGGSPLGTFDSSISGGTLSLYVTPTSSNTTITVQRTLVSV